MSCHKEEEFYNLRVIDKSSRGGDTSYKKEISTLLRELENEPDFS